MIIKKITHPLLNNDQRLTIADLRFKNKKQQPVFIIALFFLLAIPVISASPWDFLPADNELAGWVEDTADIYVEIPDTATLYSLYNGGAGLYVSYGYIQAAKKGYTNNGEEVHIVLYELVSADSGLSLYEGLSVGVPGAVAIDSIGDSARLAETLFRSDIEVLIGKYLYRINVRKDTGQHQVGADFAQVIENKINATPVRSAAQVLPDRQPLDLVINHTPGEQAVVFTAADNLKVAIFRMNGKEELAFTLLQSATFTWYTGEAEPGIYLAAIEDQVHTYIKRINILK